MSNLLRFSTYGLLVSELLILGVTLVRRYMGVVVPVQGDVLAGLPLLLFLLFSALTVVCFVIALAVKLAGREVAFPVVTFVLAALLWIPTVMFMPSF